MAKPAKEGPEPSTRNEATTRVDLAHAASPMDEANPSPSPPLDLLEAIAGHDAQSANQQLRGQALELAGILKEKQRLLEQRESELNARTAILENELRQARLRQYHDLPAYDDVRRAGAAPDIPTPPATVPADAVPLSVVDGVDHESEAWPAEFDLTIEPAPSPACEQKLSHVTPPPRATHSREAAAEPHELDLLATGTQATAFQSPATQATGTSAAKQAPGAPDPWSWPPVSSPRPASPDESPLIQTDLSAAARRAEAEHFQQQAATLRTPGPSGATGPHASRGERRAEQVQLDQQRQLLRVREDKLARREQHVDQLHGEVIQLHREALELRLATEQVWAELSNEYPAEKLARSLSEIRAKIADHYRLANDTLARRKDELHELHADLARQEQRLRQQRREIQLWADRRYDEIETRVAALIVKERELDQLEGDFERQSFQWQQQREKYRQEIELLSWKLHEQSSSR